MKFSSHYGREGGVRPRKYTSQNRKRAMRENGILPGDQARVQESKRGNTVRTESMSRTFKG